MVVIATGLSGQQQGFYFTFSSLLALQTFFDLGLMFVLAQFASHEFVNLSWGRNGSLEGEPIALKRFTDLLCKTTLWFGVAALLMMMVLIPTGLIFFGQKGHVDFHWRLPWVLAVSGTALNLFVMPFFALIMGSGDVVTVNKRELVAAISSSILCWAVIGFNGGLYAAFAVNLGALFISWGYLLARWPKLVKLALQGWFGEERIARKASGGLSWWGEIWPMQWRMAVSSGAAYFIFQLFNPILFHYHGSVVAGQMGMTLSASNALFAGGMTLIGSRNPELAKYVAARNWGKLDERFFYTLRQTIWIVTSGALLGFALIWFLQNNYTIGSRFISYEYAGLLFVTIVIHVVIGNFVVYIRSHKKDPLALPTVILSIVQGVVTIIMGRYYSAGGVVVGYFVVTIVCVLPTIFVVWSKCRNTWHKG